MKNYLLNYYRRIVEHYINFLNSSKIFAGCVMLLMNLGGRYIVNELPGNMEKIFDTPWIRRLIIFSLFFFTTRDIKISILLTLAFILIFKFLLDEKSKFCILNKSLDNQVSKKDAVEAYQVLQNYKKQNGKININV